jgi:acyl-CoA reductase-like NAD-dependent aldehyde dehydrogenase
MFDDFYCKYPKKVARKDAQKAWARLTAEQQQKALQAIDDHVRMWAA